MMEHRQRKHNCQCTIYCHYYTVVLGHFGGKIILLINNLPWEYNYCTDTLSEYYFWVEAVCWDFELVKTRPGVAYSLVRLSHCLLVKTSWSDGLMHINPHVIVGGTAVGVLPFPLMSIGQKRKQRVRDQDRNVRAPRSCGHCKKNGWEFSLICLVAPLIATRVVD